jgi:hypothetical protein
MEFSKGQDRMISLLEEQAKTQRVVCQYLMEQKHGKDSPTFGGNIGASGSQGGNGNQEESIHMGHTRNIPFHSQVASKATPRLYFPTFRTSQPRDYNPLSQETMEDEWETMEREYNNMIAGFRRQVSLLDFYHLKLKKKSKEHHRGDIELGCKASRMEMPTFDGTNQISATTWVQKLDAYLQLNSMEEANAIKYTTLHLMGKAHDWWFHEITTLGHGHVTSYKDFTQRLIDGFDREDLELHFRELTQIKQTGFIEAFIEEFQRVVVKVSDMSESRLLMIYTEALNEPLRGWVKAFKPTTLQDAIERTRDLIGAASKNKFTPKPLAITKSTGPRQFDKGKGPLDEATGRELRRKKLCFICKESWQLGHKCWNKGKIHYIEVVSDS